MLKRFLLLLSMGYLSCISNISVASQCPDGAEIGVLSQKPIALSLPSGWETLYIDARGLEHLPARERCSNSAKRLA